MKFTPREDIRSKGRIWEAGNTYDSQKHGVDDADVDRWYNAGWTEVEGRDPAPERKVTRATLKPHSTKHKGK